jgi:hypothetical protein
MSQNNNDNRGDAKRCEAKEAKLLINNKHVHIEGSLRRRLAGVAPRGTPTNGNERVEWKLSLARTTREKSVTEKRLRGVGERNFGGAASERKSRGAETNGGGAGDAENESERRRRERAPETERW